MTAGLLGLAELAAASEVPAEQVHRHAEAGLLPPAHRDGDRLGYPPAETDTVRLLAGAEHTGDWAEVTRQSLPQFEDAALETAGHTAGCGDGCGCLTALYAPVTTYQFPTVTLPNSAGPACDLAAEAADPLAAVVGTPTTPEPVG